MALIFLHKKYDKHMVKAKLIGYLAIYLIFWKNIAAIAVSVISLYFSFKHILLKKQSTDRLFIKKVKLKQQI